MSAANKGLVGLFKRGMNEVPEIMFSSIMGLAGVGIAVFTCYLYYQKDGDNRRYKDHYTVYRHDDPRVDRIRKD